MRLFAHLALYLPLLLLSGCFQDFGPRGVPELYAVVPGQLIDEKDSTMRLQQLQREPDEVYLISPYDRFNVMVYEHPELEVKDIVVTPDGFLSAPLIGPIKIGGMNLEKANQAVTERFKKYLRNPLVSLVPVYINGYNFTILGKVNYPGRYPVTQGIRLLDAIALARGLAQGVFHGDTVEAADLENAYIVRKGELLPVNFRKAIHEGNALHNIPLRNGDYIYIPSEMTTAVYVLGEVSKPTYVGYKEGMTFLKAVSFAQGFLDSRSRYAHVIRGGLKHPKLYNIDIDLISTGNAMDFPLEPNDIIYISKSGIAAWNTVVRDIVPSLQALNMLAGPFSSSATYFNAN